MERDAADRQIEIRIDYLGGGVASVQCLCHRYVDLLQLIDMPDGWKIVNAAWRLRWQRWYCLRPSVSRRAWPTRIRKGP
jgi:hypothetical protein